MKKHELLRYGDTIIRVLDVQQDKIMIIDCIKRTMPVWVDSAVLDSYASCSEDDLRVATGISILDIDTMDSEQRKTMYDRYTIIAPVLPFVADDKMRSTVIQTVAIENGVSKQTIRSYLCLYLAYMNIAALAPKVKSMVVELSQDEKNMRWALNKFFYTKHKNPLTTAYTMMLKEKYCNSMGELTEDYPSFYQFRYFYRKTRKMQNYYISRDGLTHYQRNNRPLTGEGIQEFAPAVGTGMLDATVCDIYLVNDAGNLVGRPILTACIDAYSGLCCGYSLSWEGGVYSLRGLLLNVIADKSDWCRQFGISIRKEDWPCDVLPATLVTDMGSEYKSENFEQIAELGVTVVNLPSYRPELKGMVEKFFDLIQETYKKYLKGKGVIEPDYQERGAHDYRRDACLTMRDFEKIVLHCIIYYNSQRVIENFPYTEDMIAAEIKPYASAIWNWNKNQMGANLIAVDERELILTLVSMQRDYHNLLPLPKRKTDADRYLRYCPLCAEQDREIYGETYWHRAHQMIGLNVCPEHGCYLEDSSIITHSKAPPMLKTAEESIPLTGDIKSPDNDMELRVAWYMAAVFQMDVDLDSDVSVGRFLHSKMANTPYCSTRGEQRNIGLLHADFLEHYRSLPGNWFTELWQLQKVMTDDRTNFYEICLLALFLNIPAGELGLV